MKMKCSKVDSVMVLSRLRSLHLLMGLVLVYVFLMTTQFPVFFRFLDRNHHHSRFLNETPKLPKKTPSKILSTLVFPTRKNDNTSIYVTAMHAWVQGGNLWAQVTGPRAQLSPQSSKRAETFRCPEYVSVEETRFNGEVKLPCGMTIGSHVTVVGQPKAAHQVDTASISLMKNVLVSQFMVELRKEKTFRNEETSRLLHFNPRIKGDWSEYPVIEMNNCFRGQWGTAVRCDGWGSPLDEETVDGQLKCEKWMRDDLMGLPEELRATILLDMLTAQRKKVGNFGMEWPYPFAEGKMFVLTISTGLEGYHASVNGRHVTSFAYRNGFDLEDAMTLNVYGDVDVHSVYAGSLPTSHPSIAPERHLEMSDEWKAQPLPDNPILLFVGVISAGDHFAERMAARKSWMQHHLIKTSRVVARFFVALHAREAINVELKKEAEYFGDIIIVPYLDHYDLVVLKTLAICEYGVKMLSAKYIMKCDDDTFVRVDAVIEEAGQVGDDKSLYMGKINYYHEPFRSGKWAVNLVEWPGDVYPPYADGPGYIVSSDIARFIISEFKKTRLRLFKMEDVSMGVWVEQFNSTRPVEYLHNPNFHQSGCMDGYITAHYQSPKQLVCLWEKLQSEGIPRCCNLR